DGHEHCIVFAGGEVIEPLEQRGTVPRRRTGTRVRVWPDPRYFDSAHLPMADLVHALRSKAVLLSGTRVSLHIEKTGETREWHYESGLRGYLMEGLGEAECIVPLFEGAQYAEADD